MKVKGSQVAMKTQKSDAILMWFEVVLKTKKFMP
jgi:hypothetical protein